MRGRKFARVESVVRGDVTTQCIEPVVTCLSCCQVLPQPMEVAAAHTCAGNYEYTYLLQHIITLPAKEEPGD